MRGSGARLVTTAIVPDSRFPFPQSLQKSGNSNREVHRLSRFRNHQTACSCLPMLRLLTAICVVFNAVVLAQAQTVAPGSAAPGGPTLMELGQAASGRARLPLPPQARLARRTALSSTASTQTLPLSWAAGVAPPERDDHVAPTPRTGRNGAVTVAKLESLMQRCPLLCRRKIASARSSERDRQGQVLRRALAPNGALTPYAMLVAIVRNGWSRCVGTSGRDRRNAQSRQRSTATAMLHRSRRGGRGRLRDPPP